LLTTKAIVSGSTRVTVLPRGVVAGELEMDVLRAIRLREASFDRRVGVRLLRGRRLSHLARALLEAVGKAA
jgi:hypothetical protein